MMNVFLDPTAAAAELIGAVKMLPGMAALYETRVRHYILEEHTRLVLGQFDLHFRTLDLPIARELFRFLLTVHDIGKPQAAKEQKLSNQYQYTIRMVESFRSKVPFSQSDTDCCLAIIGGDPLG